MLRLNRREFNLGLLATGAAVLAAPALTGRALAARPVLIASLLGQNKPETKVWLKIRDFVEAKLPGRFAFNIVPNAALGGEKDVNEGLRLGAIQGSLSTVSALSAWAPESQLFDMPFLFRDADHVRATVASKPGDALKAKLEGEGFIVGDYVNYGARHLLAKEPLTRPGDVAGKRLRVIQSPLHATLWESFGAVPVGLPITETYNALATGVVDAMDLTKSAYAGFRLYEVVPDVIETGHIWASGAIIFAKPFWNGLTAEEQDVFRDAAIEGARHFNTLIVADEAASGEVAKTAGARFLAAEDREEWVAGARKVWAAYADKVGGMEAIEAVRVMG
ncbi:TRAP transporter substrate-binding protein [Ensifer sp. T173]|uniref:TRAP transporter substrate-binding protein n=1 Tax=Ensifer canadensis TaxID=555315 RepID=A0AAW4FVT4_9HYPH|nr:TRAP transporter substrate-binding protein [Ensifer canadensis]MBM3095530.1 TRAP transporter substrate-binding protein [Ensifer canadensis]UBI79124.1 TRAP transporter substrate-binding protein [Ensifer canadensis]